MSDRRPIESEIRARGPEDDGGEGAEELSEERRKELLEERLKEALSLHAAGVTIVAVREGAGVQATTVTSFAPISVDPPVVMVSVGGNAQVLPFLDEGTAFVVNLLRGDQRRLASVYADSFPVGPSPFAEEGDPVIPDALAALRCRVRSIVPVDGTHVVLGRVVAVELGDAEEALVHFRRTYHTLR